MFKYPVCDFIEKYVEVLVVRFLFVQYGFYFVCDFIENITGCTRVRLFYTKQSYYYKFFNL